MPGQRTPYQATFLTERVLYRSVASADSVIPDGPALNAGNQLPIIDLSIDPASAIRNEQNTGVKYTNACYQHNAVLELFVLLTNLSAATLSVYAWGEPGQVPADVASMKGSWCKLGSFTVTESTLLSLVNIPAAIYRVCVDSLTPAAEIPEGESSLLRIAEQHTF